MKKFVIELVGFILVMVMVLGCAAFTVSRQQASEVHEGHLRWNKKTAIALMPANATGPYQQAQADEALKKLHIPDDLVPVVLAYQVEGTGQVGCVLATNKTMSTTAENSKARSVAEACAEVGARYRVDYAQELQYEKEPSFWKTPFTRNLGLAQQALPRGAASGNAAQVLPLLEKAKFPEDQEVVIVSWNNYDEKAPLKGCVLVGTMGTFKASDKTEASACEKVIAMAKGTKV